MSVFDREGARLFRTNEGQSGDKDHTVVLRPHESIVGYRSCTENGDACHRDFQLIIESGMEANYDLKACDLFVRFAERVLPGVAGAQRNLKRVVC